MEYLTYIDNFSVQLIMLSFILILAIALVFWFAKAFSTFLNELFDLNKSKNVYKNYDTFKD